MSISSEKKLEAIYSPLFESVPERSRKTIQRILEGAIDAYLKYGIKDATYERIAELSGVSRPLLHHYFPGHEQLFVMVTRYIRVKFQQLAIEAIRRPGTYAARLGGYVSALFVWMKKYPRHAKVWSFVFHYSVVSPSIRKINTELATMGHERITELLRAGARAGEFSDGDFKKRAKMIQALYTGGGVMFATEDLEMDRDSFRQAMVEACLKIAGYSEQGPEAGRSKAGQRRKHA